LKRADATPELWTYGSDDPVPSPYVPTSDAPPRYLAFELDLGAFNNIWLNLEVMALLAWLTGRALVLPPPWRFRLLGEQASSLLDFIDRETLERSLPVLTAEEFVERTGFDLDPSDGDAFNAGLERIAATQAWHSDKDAIVVPADALTRRFELIPRLLKRRPIALDGPLDSPEILYVPSSETTRILGPFESFVLFADPQLERRARRFVRDALRYHPRILQSASRILHASGLDQAPYSSMHIRRGDFQYLETRVAAQSVVDYTSEFLQPGETVYVATDEPNPDFLAPLRADRPVVAWPDLSKDLTAAVPERYVGVVETLIIAAATGRFFGTRLSTFSVRAAVLRGHLSRTPGGPREGVDTTLRCTQPPIDGAPGDDEASRLPWWESVAHTPLWGRAYQSTWSEVE